MNKEHEIVPQIGGRADHIEKVGADLLTASFCLFPKPIEQNSARSNILSNQ